MRGRLVVSNDPSSRVGYQIRPCLSSWAMVSLEKRQPLAGKGKSFTRTSSGPFSARWSLLKIRVVPFDSPHLRASPVATGLSELPGTRGRA